MRFSNQGCFVTFFISLICPPPAFSSVLSLEQAERLAVAKAPELTAIQAKQNALQKKAIAKGQLDDPKIMLGFSNIPADTFDFKQEPMTQEQIVIEQKLPKGKSLKYQYQMFNQLSEAAQFGQKEMVLKVKKGVRMAWVKLSFWMQAQKIIEREEREFFHLVQVTKAMLANNKAQQKDVIRAQLEHTSAQNKLINIKENINIAKNELARWIGDKEALNASPKRVPNWDAYGNRRSLLSELLQHPLLQSDSAKISSQKASIQHSKEQFKPGLTLGGGYGFRQGSNSNGSKRSDFIQLRVGVSMPVFPENRQKKLLDVSQQELLEKEATKATHYRVLKEQLNNSLTAYEQKSESMHLFETAFIPEAKQYAQSTLSAYENAQTDFPTLARAYIKQYNTEINALKANLARSFAEINLLYIKGI